MSKTIPQFTEDEQVNVTIRGARVAWTDGRRIQFDLGEDHPGIGSTVHGFAVTLPAPKITVERVPTTVDRGHDDARAELVAGLRELADFYEQHPDMPLPPYPQISHCVHVEEDVAGIVEVGMIADELGVEPKLRRDALDHYRVARQFGGISFQAYYVPRDRSIEYDKEQAYLSSWKAAGKPALPEVGAESHPDGPAIPDLDDEPAPICGSYVFRFADRFWCHEPRGHAGDHADGDVRWCEGDEPVDA